MQTSIPVKVVVCGLFSPTTTGAETSLKRDIENAVRPFISSAFVVINPNSPAGDSVDENSKVMVNG